MFFENKIICCLNKNGIVLKTAIHTNSKGSSYISEERGSSAVELTSIMHYCFRGLKLCASWRRKQIEANPWWLK